MIQKPTAIDTIIQSSTVELLQTYGVSVAPRSRTVQDSSTVRHEVIGIISFDAPGIGGRLTLAMPEAVFASMSRGRTPSTTLADWTREATNQLMGRIKNRLLQFQVRLRTHIPTVLSGAALERQQLGRGSPQIAYNFSALRGDVVVTVDPSVANAMLDYSNASIVVQEGELILFD